MNNNSSNFFDNSLASFGRVGADEASQLLQNSSSSIASPDCYMVTEQIGNRQNALECSALERARLNSELISANVEKSRLSRDCEDQKEEMRHLK